MAAMAAMGSWQQALATLESLSTRHDSVARRVSRILPKENSLFNKDSKLRNSAEHRTHTKNLATQEFQHDGAAFESRIKARAKS